MIAMYTTTGGGMPSSTSAGTSASAAATTATTFGVHLSRANKQRYASSDYNSALRLHIFHLNYMFTVPGPCREADGRLLIKFLLDELFKLFGIDQDSKRISASFSSSQPCLTNTSTIVPF